MLQTTRPIRKVCAPHPACNDWGCKGSGGCAQGNQLFLNYGLNNLELLLRYGFAVLNGVAGPGAAACSSCAPCWADSCCGRGSDPATGIEAQSGTGIDLTTLQYSCVLSQFVLRRHSHWTRPRLGCECSCWYPMVCFLHRTQHPRQKSSVQRPLRQCAWRSSSGMGSRRTISSRSRGRPARLCIAKSCYSRSHIIGISEEGDDAGLPLCNSHCWRARR